MTRRLSVLVLLAVLATVGTGALLIARERASTEPEVTTVRFLRPEFIGPKRLFVIASVDLEGDRVESSIARTLRDRKRLRDEVHVPSLLLSTSARSPFGR